MMNKLDCAVSLTNRLINYSKNGSYIYGTIENLLENDLPYLEILINLSLVEISNPIDKSSVDFHSINTFLTKDVFIEFKVGNISTYYDTLYDFITKNKFKLRQTDYFIKELNYRASRNIKINDFIIKYKTNLELIDFLKDICDYDKSLGNVLKLFFYRTSNGVELDIEYTLEDIKKIKFNIDENFILNFKVALKGSDRKQLFINELINFLDKNGNSYQKLLEGWDILISNYEISYALFLEGFSFDKIKNSSTEYFQNIVDRIYDSIAKASNYIFGVPIGFIFLLNNFDFSGISIFKNTNILILGIIFYTMIRVILFENIKQSIEAIEDELEKFLKKIENYTELNEIHEQLINFKNIDLKRQYSKIHLVKVLTTIIFIIFCLTYLYVFIDLSIFLT
jgi:hypothetical protein